MSRFGEVARAARRERHWSLRAVARHLGFSAPYISDIERGNRYPPSDDVIRRWAAFLNQPADDWVRLAQQGRPSVRITPAEYQAMMDELERLRREVTR